MSLSRSLSLALVLVLAGFGCRSGGSKGGGDQPDGGGNQGGDDTIFDVQDPANGMAVGTPVTLRGVVVVAIDSFGGRTGGLYVMEPEGGAYSGVYVYVSGTAAADVAVGDLIDIEGGVKDEFGLEDTCDRDSDCTVTEISAPQGGSIQLTQVGSGTVPEPEVLQPQDLAADDTEAEKWEGVLIKFENVRVFNGPYGVDKDDPTLQAMDVTGPFNVQSELTEFSGIAEGDCYSSITGIGHYIFDYRLYPRSADDLAAGGDSCLDPEAGDSLCGDTKDNDFNGLTDCDERGCLGTATACPATDSTVVEVQDGTRSEGDIVRLTDVVVTARSYDGETVWVQDNAAAGENNGVLVFNDGELSSDIDIGATLTLVGRTDEFDYQDDSDNTVTEVKDITIESSTPGGGTPKIVNGPALGTLLTEPYEGVLVKDSGLSVTAVDGQAHQFTVSDGTDSVVVDDDIFRYDSAAVDQCLQITGVMHYNSFDNIVVLLPRDGEVTEVAAAMCN